MTVRPIEGVRSGRVALLLATAVLAAALAGCGAGPRPTPTPQGTSIPAAGRPAGGQAKQYAKAPEMTIDKNKQYHALIKTNLGDIKVELNAKDAPVTVNNFVFLAREGYYNGTPFHRVIKGFMIQGGDPTGTGTGGPGYKFPDEPPTRQYDVGSVAMANSGPNTNGSQFFICEGDGCKSLPRSYNLFGKVVEGIDVVSKIASVPTAPSPGNPNERSKPTQDVQINTVEISEQ